MEIKNKFKLFLGIKVGLDLFKQLVPFGAILLLVAFLTTAGGRFVLNGVAESIYLFLISVILTMILMVKIQHLHEQTDHTNGQVLKESMKLFLPALIAGAVLFLIKFILNFAVGFMMPWPPLLHALDVLLAVMFLFLNHCIALGKDEPFEAINNAMVAYSKNKIKVWFLGLFMIVWKLVTLLPMMTLVNTLVISLVGPLLMGILFCIAASLYYQMIRKENQGAYQYE